MDNRALRQLAAQRLDTPHTKPLARLYALGGVGALLAAQLCSFLLSLPLENTGGLGGLGLRAALTAAQTVVMLAVSALLPFWDMGYVAVALTTARGQQADRQTLFSGFARFLPLLRLMLLQGAVIFAVCLAGSHIATILYMFSPASGAVLVQMEQLLASEAAADPNVLMQLLGMLWPMYALMAVVMLALLIPVSYRLRLAQLRVMDGENRALLALVGSWRTMRGRCLQLARLDLGFWYYYALMALGAAVAFGDTLVLQLGLPVDENVAFWVFYLLSLGLQGFATYRFAPRAHTTYAAFYQSLLPDESVNGDAL